MKKYFKKQKNDTFFVKKVTKRKENGRATSTPSSRGGRKNAKEEHGRIRKSRLRVGTAKGKKK